ncbi:ROK family transcriptional regulator [Saccharomonospora saliphila]|uniref:ROK family transcriptional regulator n=1 Tax=Saccharomonospora saliphila TaxID=369829 RepID=UPI00048B31AB|nr:ROK family transcriptional regulator [Saccharomonospora saliphila]
MQAGGNPQTLRLMNCAAVLTVLQEVGAARVTELMRATGLSRPTVTAAVSTLIDDGLVEEAETLEADVPRMGRPARVLRFRADARYVLGVDVGPHRVYCEVADLNGTIVARQRRDVTAEGDAHANLLDGVEATMSEVLAKAGVPLSALASVGVGMPGIVDPRRGAVVQAPSMPGRDFLELGRLLQRNVSCPVHVENDVNLAAMAERWRGAGSQTDNLLLVQWGSRVGAAVLLRDQLLRGAHDAAGEIGFVDLEDEPQGVQAGGHGPLESSVGTAWIVRRARSLGDDRSTDAAAVLTAAADGDARALQVVDEVCARLARGLAPFLLAVDPELVIIGGGIVLAGDAVLTALRHHLTKRVIVVPRIALSRLGDDAVALGAVHIALTEAHRRLLDPYTAPNTKPVTRR